jgi:hypothetical protein
MPMVLQTCGEKPIDDPAKHDARVLNCLQDHRLDLSVRVTRHRLGFSACIDVMPILLIDQIFGRSCRGHVS